VTVETSKGSVTVAGGFHYLASTQLYPIAGALDDLVYDQARQRLYISNQDHNLGFGSGLAAMASSPDGGKILLADTSGIEGMPIGLLDLVANTLTTADGNIFATGFGISNAQLSRMNIMAFEKYADSGAQSLHNVFGEKLNPSGSLLFSPQDTGVNIFDVHTGRLVRHVALPEVIPQDFGSMVLDETGTKMFLISNSGITIAQLFEAPLSLATVHPATGTVGTHITLRGSGFQNGATVAFGVSQVSATFVDQNTITATVPALSGGPLRITVTNPDGRAYTFDSVFTVQ